MDRDLLKGSIAPQLAALSLPLLLGNVLQQLYNGVDAFILGRWAGDEAFAAVGIAGSVMNLFIFVLGGICAGISVLFAQLHGAGDQKGYRREMFLSLTFGGGFTLGLMILCLLAKHPVLRLIQTPAELLPLVSDYLSVIIGGFLATYLYNLCAAALRSVGRTGAALLFLALSMGGNALLDLLFVAVWQKGVAGAAWATVLSQAFSALASGIYLLRTVPAARFHRSDMVLDKALLRDTARLGLVSAMHQSSLYIGKLLVQGAVNTMGTAGIGAYTAATRIEGFINSFSDSGAEAISVFVAQNTGAGQKARARQGLSCGMKLMILLCLAAALGMAVFAPQLIGVFLTESGEALEEGTSYLRLVAVFYVCNFIGAAFVGFFRGTGRVQLPVIGTTVHISVRVLLSYLLVGKLGLSAVALATGIGWIVVSSLHTFFYHRIRQKESAETC
ncbi:MAG: MATE family efflux transporter [Oscillospiraceae bacterium]|nr:MATE family efflux transporter [Oscillospiraceae bacterium]